MLLVCAGLFATNLRHAMAVDTGFRTDGLLLATFDPGLDGRSRVPTEEIFITLRSRLRAVPGVTSVGLAKYVPLQTGGAQRLQSSQSLSPGVTTKGFSNLWFNSKYRVISASEQEAPPPFISPT